MELLTQDLWNYFSRFGSSQALVILQTASKNLHQIVWSGLTTTLMLRQKAALPSTALTQANKITKAVLLFPTHLTVALLAGLPSLTELQLKGCQDFSFLEKLSLRGLTTLGCSKKENSHVSASNALPIGYCTSLTSLHLAAVVMSPVVMSLIALLTNLASLGLFNSFRGGSARHDEALVPLRALTKLNHLHLDGAVSRSIDWILALSNLKSLDFDLPDVSSWLDTIPKLNLEHTRATVFTNQDPEHRVSAIPSLKSLTLMSSSPDYLVENPSLENIRLELSNVRHLQALTTLTNLTKLHAVVSHELENRTTALEKEMAPTLNQLTNLQVLHLMNHHGRPSFLEDITLTSLHYLQLVTNFERAPCLNAIGNMKHLTCLDLNDCGLTAPAVSQSNWPNLSQLRSLRILYLRNNKLNDASISYVASSISTLDELILHGNPVGDQGTQNICRSNPNISFLDLKYTQISPNGFCALTHLTGLTQVDAQRRFKLEPFIQLTSLRRLNLLGGNFKGNLIEDDDLKYLANHHHLDKLSLGNREKGHGLTHLQHLKIKELNLLECLEFHKGNLKLLKNWKFLVVLWLPDHINADQELLDSIPRLRKLYKNEPNEELVELGRQNGISIRQASHPNFSIN